MKGIIYKATNSFNGLVYIGQTINTLEKRKARHIRDAKIDESNRFHTALYQYPSAFEWEVIDTFVGDRQYVTHSLNIAEEYHILKHNSVDESRGYNANTGGYSSKVLSERIKLLARKHEGTCKAMLQYDLSGKFIKEWESLSEISRRFSPSNKACASELTHGVHYGYMWRIKESEYYPNQIQRYVPYNGHKAFTPVVVYDYNGDYCGGFKSQREALNKYEPMGKVRIMRGEIRNIRLTHNSTPKYFLFKRPDNNYPAKIIITPFKKKEKVKKETVFCGVGVSAYNLNGDYVASYKTMADACEQTGCTTQSIKRYCEMDKVFIPLHSRTKYVWRYTIDDMPSKIEITDYRPKKLEKMVWETMPDGSRMRVRRIVTENRFNTYSKMEHRIIQYTKTGEFVKVWENAHQAAESGLDSTTFIYKSLKGQKTKRPTNFIWRYYTNDYPLIIAVEKADDVNKVDRVDKREKNKPAPQLRERKVDKIAEINGMGEIVATFNGTADAAEKTGFSQSYICNVLAGKIHHPRKRFKRI